MKTKPLLLAIFFGFAQSLFAQSAIADLKFEEAEIAFKKITNR